MILADYHVHTTFSDGKNTPEEMVLAAIRKGMTAIGFTDHSYTDIDESYCIPKARIQVYLDTVHALQDTYSDRIRILCGIEQDYYSDYPTDAFDYVIGSLHYFHLGDEYIAVDHSAAVQKDAAERYFGGDLIALYAHYFETVSHVAEKTGADVIGHFDLVSKFNEGGKLFDEADPRYRAAALSAADALLRSGKPFEINTGAISRGYRSDAYPSPWLREYIRSHGGKFILNGDSHSADALCTAFENYTDWADDTILPH